MRTFKSFLQLNEAGYGITHIEDLPVETFLRLIKGLDQLKAVQKLDGANLIMGIDREGKLYTSREQKGGKRFYKVTDYPAHSAYDGFKTAHAVLEKVQDTIKKIVQAGTAVNCEILFGAQPNTVIYGKNNLSYIAFLEAIPGDDPSKELDDNLPAKLYDRLKNQRITVQTKISDTTDGSNIIRAPKITDWGFSKSDPVQPEKLAHADVMDDVKELEAFLKKINKAAYNQGFDLTNFEVLKHRSPKLKDEKDRLTQIVHDKYMMPIKKKILKVVNSLQPSLRGQNPDAQNGYSGIEGIILTDPKTKEQFKVVDKEEFTAVNKFNYEVRNRLTGRISTANDEADIESRGGIVGDAKIRCVRMFGIPGTEVPSQAKKVLEKFKGSSKKETLQSIAESLHSLKFEAIKRKMRAILTNALVDLDEELEDFKKNADKMSLKLADGKKVKYTPEIKRRTLMTFAEAHKTVNKLLTSVREASTMEELLNVFFSSAIDEMHAEVTE
jgi:hypothetical protein